jgi:hypothetical protein
MLVVMAWGKGGWIVMCLKIYCEHGCTRSKGPFSSVKPCAIGVSRPSSEHGKSPCFSRSCVLRFVGVGQQGLVLHVVDVGVFDD